MQKPAFVLLLVTSGLVSCSPVGPDYEQPAIDLPDSFVDGDAASPETAGARAWWLDFHDPTLNDLVMRGLDQNLDIQKAVELIEEARAVVRTTGRAAQLSGDGSLSYLRGDEGYGAETNGSATLNAGYVFDIFGGIQRGRQQAQAEYESAVYGVGTARLALLTDLLGAYIDARYYQEAAAVTRKTIADLRETLALTEGEQDQGIVSSLDYASAEALLHEARASLPEYQAGFYRSVYTIATLQGEPAAPLVERLQSGARQPLPKGDSAVGVPADLLRNRPDVAAAERDLAAATAAIGVAAADLYPSLSLDGTVTASDPSTWSFGPTLTLPIFNRPALRATRDQEISLARQAELTWRTTVLTAIEEVQAAQTNYLQLLRQVEARRAEVASYARVVELSSATYQAGTTSLLDLLEDERDSDDARLLLAESIQALANAWVTLQIASGQGWRMAPS